MSAPSEPEASRARPLSGGLWTLFSWLRRDDGGSSDSLSSAGSDRTVASFAFLPPAHCRHAAPAALPPPSPPTDSYRRRVRDRDLRRHHDRDLTLHRKYGLYRDLTVGYDVTSLPSGRRSTHTDKQDRDRRATSESLQLRTPHVPGKRRAPPPPARTALGTFATLPHRHSRKRRAPQPPIKFEEKVKENIVAVKNTEMNPQSRSKNFVPLDVSRECKSEKYVKKENTSAEAKSKQEKNFLKQIFDIKKRRSAIETSSIKILPSISELDKQAAELIESCRLKEQNNNVLNIDQKGSEIAKGPRWICITCLRRFDVSVNRCTFCSISANQKPMNNFKTENKNETIFTQTEKDLRILPTEKNLEDEERKKLKKMLKEMKDSLPKKHEPSEDIANKNLEPVTSNPLLNKGPVSITETPTLRIGSPRDQELKISPGEPSASKIVMENSKISACDNTNEIVRNILFHSNLKSEEALTKKVTTNDKITITAKSSSNSQADTQWAKIDVVNINNTESVGICETRRLNEPLKISSLLNPVYVPKQRAGQFPNNPPETSKSEVNDVNIRNEKSDKMKIQNETPAVPSTSNISNIPKVASRDSVNAIQKRISPPVLKHNKRTVSTESQTSASNRKSMATKVDEVNQHSRRRDLINQLEKSIAEGDERAAANAAAKLAQLRLTCSVLSFTSQILGQLSNQDNAIQKTEVKNENIIQHSEVDGVLNNPASKVTVVPSSSKGPGVLSEEKQEIRKDKTDYRPADKQEPSCSKSSDKKANNNKTDASSSQQVVHVDGSNTVSISVWIEDKNAAHGPIKVEIPRSARLGELRARTAAQLGIARALQRWIVGRTLCLDDQAPLAALAGPALDAPFYLCLVELDTKHKSASPNIDERTDSVKNGKSSENAAKSDNDKAGDVYTELMQLERQAIVPNGDKFECQVCMEDCPAGHGVVLRECVHSFCRNCLADMIRHGEEPTVSCPAMGCPGTLHEREIRALVSREEYERWLARGLAAAESGTRNAFHCRTRDCTGWALCEAGVRKFPCPVCKHNNCVPCQAIHEGETCEQYRAKLQQASNKVANQTDEGTKALLDSLIARGEALECPECTAIITKKWGCDWVKCSACKTEICWVTRGRRWGPAGRGDTSAGCRCGLDGKKCHPSCGYCH